MRWLNRTRVLVLAVVLLAISGIGFVSLSRSDAATDPLASPGTLVVETVVVERVHSFQSAREYTGTVVARRTSGLGFELSGKLNAILVEEGAEVSAGAPLAELDTEHLETRRRQVAAQRAEAAAKLDEMITGPREEDIAAARARVAGLEADVELLRRQTDRQQRLLDRNATSLDAFEEFSFQLQARQAQLDEACHDLEELLNGTRREQITAQQATVEALDAAVADIDVDLRKSTLRAPFAGTVARRSVDEGVVVEAGQEIVRLVEDAELEVWAGLPVAAAMDLVEGMEQRVKIGGRTYSATVAGRFPEVDRATRTRTVILRLERSAAAEVVQGEVVRLHLTETLEATGYWLPATALSKGQRGLWAAYVAMDVPKSVDARRIERRDVEILHTEGDRVLVRGALEDGEFVVAGGTHRVAPGQLVRLAQ